MQEIFITQLSSCLNSELPARLLTIHNLSKHQHFSKSRRKKAAIIYSLTRNPLLIKSKKGKQEDAQLLSMYLQMFMFAFIDGRYVQRFYITSSSSFETKLNSFFYFFWVFLDLFENTQPATLLSSPSLFWWEQNSSGERRSKNLWRIASQTHFNCIR